MANLLRRAPPAPVASLLASSKQGIQKKKGKERKGKEKERKGKERKGKERERKERKRKKRKGMVPTDRPAFRLRLVRVVGLHPDPLRAARFKESYLRRATTRQDWSCLASLHVWDLVKSHGN